jgi:hypothetical protein
MDQDAMLNISWPWLYHACILDEWFQSGRFLKEVGKENNQG